MITIKRGTVVADFCPCVVQIILSARAGLATMVGSTRPDLPLSIVNEALSTLEQLTCGHGLLVAIIIYYTLPDCQKDAFAVTVLY